MLQKPAIQWVPSPNYGYPEKTPGRNGRPILAIVIHITDGGVPDNWFASTASQVSAHYCVTRAGAVHQYVADTDAAWANGLGYENGQWITPSNAPVQPTAKTVLAHPGVNPNYYTIGIENEGKPNEWWPTTQIETLTRLVAYLCKTYHLPVDRDHIIGHYEINPVDRPNCPGPSFPWVSFMKGVQTMLNQDGRDPAPVLTKHVQTIDDVLGVSQSYEGVMKWAVLQLAVGSDDSDSAARMHRVRLALQLALGNVFVADKSGVPIVEQMKALQ